MHPSLDPLSLEFMVENSLEMLKSYQSIGMRWWATSVVFCASILGAIWRNRTYLIQHPLLKSLELAIAFFMISIVAFGAMMAYHCWSMLHDFLQLSTQNTGNLIHFEKEFWVTTWGYLIATSSFVLITISWFVLMSHIRKLTPEGKRRRWFQFWSNKSD